ncbi:GntR family transcriptional regulator [Polaribacter aestuariivivens]|uniref:GntR family transcriptional regulator n=1 Tax=Polaribacter aestuariivivens TaxID=2304626 RepID=UPI003F49B31F
MEIVKLLKKSKKPKYKQIVSSIENAIVNGTLKKGDQIPSINSLRDTHNLSRDTVLAAFNELKNRGIVHSVVGKGYYVSSENISVSKKVFLLFDELNAFKEDLYNSFLACVGEHVQVDIFFHHFNTKLFNNLILDSIGDYSHYIVMPANLQDTHLVLENLPKEKVYILDQLQPELNSYAAIFQDFENDIQNGLLQGKELLKKYTKLILVFDDKVQPKGMKIGFQKFCTAHRFESEVIESIKDKTPQKNEVYIIPDDRNLIRLIKKLKETSLKLNTDFGIISYNDTMLKEIVEGGITTISTDFNKMGENLANILQEKEQKHIKNPTKLIIRNSL